MSSFFADRSQDCSRNVLSAASGLSEWHYSQRPSAQTALLCLISSAGLAFLHVDTVPLDFFADPSPERTSIEDAEARFPGSHILSVGFQFPEGLNQEMLQTVSAFAADLRKVDGVTFVFGAPEFAQLYDELQESGVTDATRSRLQSLPAQNITTSLASRELVISEQSDRLTNGLMESVLFALIIVWALLLLTFRKLSISLLGIIPNLLPILGIFGLLGLVSNAVNLGAAVVAACALGMVSDFTFHLLFCNRSRIIPRLLFFLCDFKVVTRRTRRTRRGRDFLVQFLFLRGRRVLCVNGVFSKNSCRERLRCSCGARWAKSVLILPWNARSDHSC